jgi:hypothetical protein
MLLLPRDFNPSPPSFAWRHVDLKGLGPLTEISQSILQHESRFGNVLPDFRGKRELFIASDYSGPQSDKASKYELFSFLIFAKSDASEWESERQRIRTELTAGRSMSFKGLGDDIRRRALPHFLEAADTIPGILITAAVSKRHQSLFQRGGQLDMHEPDLVKFMHWHRGSFEKLLRVAHFLTFYLAGLSHTGQSFFWCTDNDDIAPNIDRLRELGDIWRSIVVNLVPHLVPNLAVDTKNHDDDSRFLTDALAVSDLACGAWCQLLSQMGAMKFIHARGPEITKAAERLSIGAAQILSWFAAPSRPLKRLLCIIDEPLANNKVDYTCSIPPALDEFKRAIDANIASRIAA